MGCEETEHPEPHTEGQRPEDVAEQQRHEESGDPADKETEHLQGQHAVGVPPGRVAGEVELAA